MTDAELDKELVAAFEALAAVASSQEQPYSAWCLRMAEAHDAMRDIYQRAQEQSTLPADSVLFHALLDAELHHRAGAAEMRREAAR